MSSAGNELLIITDGTPANTARLLTSSAVLQDWLPKSPQPANQVWSSSPYLNGKSLVNKTYDNIIDTFTVAISKNKQDNTIEELRKFIRLLEQAILYWTDEFNTHKFWIEARGTCETNIRYALVVDYNIPETNNPFESPFNAANPSTIDETQFTIEHTIWTDSLEVGDDCVKISEQGGTYHEVHDTIVYPTGSDDDAYIFGGANIDTAGHQLLVGWDGANIYAFGIRFRNLPIPAGATILNAYMMFVSDAASGGAALATPDTDIAIEDALNPAAFTTYANFIGRARTGREGWFPIPFSAGAGDLIASDILTQTLQWHIDHTAGWVAGKDIVVFVTETGMLNVTDRKFRSVDAPEVTPPALHIQWTESTDTDVDVGQIVPTCKRIVSVVPYWREDPSEFAWGHITPIGLTHLYIWDDSTLTFSINHMSNPHLGPWSLFPNPIAANDAFYAGISGDPPLYGFSALPSIYSYDDYSNPFSNLIFDLATLSTSISYAYEYWSDATGTWRAFSRVSNMFGLALGKNSISWIMPTDWMPRFVNGVYGYWMRVRVTGVGGGVVIPVEEPFKIPYTVSLPYIKIAGSEIKGDIKAYIDYFITTWAASYNVSNLIIAARKVSRESATWAFRAKFSLGYGGWHDTTAFNDASRWLTTGPYPETYTLLNANIPATVYAGRYRVLIRAYWQATVAVDQIKVWLELGGWGGTYTTLEVYNKKITGGCEVMDLGVIAITAQPLYEKSLVDSGFVTFKAYAVASGACTVYFYDLFLIPIDEAVMEIIVPSITNQPTSVVNPWKIVTSNVKAGPYGFELNDTVHYLSLDPDWNDPTFQISRQLKVDILAAFELEPNEDYYIYFYMYNSGAITLGEMFAYLLTPQLDKSQHFLLMRGDK